MPDRPIDMLTGAIELLGGAIVILVVLVWFVGLR